MITAMAKLADNSIIYAIGNILKNKNFIYRGHEQQINSVAFKNGLLITASEDKNLRVWDLETKKSLYTLRGHETSIQSVVISSQILSYSSKQLIMWNYNKTWPTFLRQVRSLSSICLPMYITIELPHQVFIGTVLSIKDNTICFDIHNEYIQSFEGREVIEGTPFILTKDFLKLKNIPLHLKLADTQPILGFCNYSFKLWI